MFAQRNTNGNIGKFLLLRLFFLFPNTFVLFKLHKDSLICFHFSGTSSSFSDPTSPALLLVCSDGVWDNWKFQDVSASGGTQLEYVQIVLCQIVFVSNTTLWQNTILRQILPLRQVLLFQDVCFVACMFLRTPIGHADDLSSLYLCRTRSFNILKKPRNFKF